MNSPPGFQNLTTPAIQRPSSSSITASTPKQALATIKVVRADINENGKPSNFHRHNLTTFIPIYKEDQANVNHVLNQVRKRMNDHSLQLVGATGLKYYHEEGTKGKFVEEIIEVDFPFAESYLVFIHWY